MTIKLNIMVPLGGVGGGGGVGKNGTHRLVMFWFLNWGALWYLFPYYAL